MSKEIGLRKLSAQWVPVGLDPVTVWRHSSKYLTMRFWPSRREGKRNLGLFGKEPLCKLIEGYFPTNKEDTDSNYRYEF